jgi:hypothetical protein
MPVPDDLRRPVRNTGGAMRLPSEYTEPDNIGNYDHDTYQYYEDFVPALLAYANNGGVAFVIIGRRTHPAGF